MRRTIIDLWATNTGLFDPCIAADVYECVSTERLHALITIATDDALETLD